MGVLLIRSEPSWRSQLRHKTQAAELRSLEALSAALGHTGVEACHLISCHKARQPINQDKAAELLLEKSHSGESTHTHTHTHTYSDGLCVFVLTARLGDVPLLPPNDRRSEAAACTCTHAGTHTHTHTHTLTGAALLWHVQLWQLVFLRPLTLCDDSETGRWKERQGQGWWRGRSGVEWWTLTGGDGGAGDSSERKEG